MLHCRCSVTARHAWLETGVGEACLNHDEQLLQQLGRQRRLRGNRIEIFVNFKQHLPLLLPALLENRVCILLHAEVELHRKKSDSKSPHRAPASMCEHERNGFKHLQAAQLQLSCEQPSNRPRSNRSQRGQLSQQDHARNVVAAGDDRHEAPLGELSVHAYDETVAAWAFH
jgi:hypothetical protein